MLRETYLLTRKCHCVGLIFGILWDCRLCAVCRFWELWFYDRKDPVCLLSGYYKTPLNQHLLGCVRLSCFSSWCFSWLFPGLLCQYDNLAVGWLAGKMTQIRGRWRRLPPERQGQGDVFWQFFIVMSLCCLSVGQFCHSSILSCKFSAFKALFNTHQWPNDPTL